MSTTDQHTAETHGIGTTCLNMEVFEIHKSMDSVARQRQRESGDPMNLELTDAAENVVEGNLFVESDIDHSNVGPFVIREEPLDDADLHNIIAALGEDVGDLEQFLQSQYHLMRTVYGNEADEVGNVDFRPQRLCHVCFDTVPLHLRPCCRLAVCDPCIRAYVEMQLISNGNVRIGCPNPDCRNPVYHDEIRLVLASNQELRDRYDRWIVDLNGDPGRKTCPRCCRVTDLDDAMQAVPGSTLSLTSQPTVAASSEAADRKSTIVKNGLKVKCVECQLDWCFSCQAPWHDGMTCKQYRTGDVLLKNWARERPRPGERNAQRCPNCKVYIQRTEGCDHMTCNRCNAEFCYRCGEYRRTLTLFGFPFEDHDWKHSIIGCKERYKPDRPVQRVLARGAIFSAKVVGGVIAAPVVVGLAAGVAAIALPAYGTYRLARTVRKRLDQSDS